MDGHAIASVKKKNESSGGAGAERQSSVSKIDVRGFCSAEFFNSTRIVRTLRGDRTLYAAFLGLLLMSQRDVDPYRVFPSSIPHRQDGTASAAHNFVRCRPGQMASRTDMGRAVQPHNNDVDSELLSRFQKFFT